MAFSNDAQRKGFFGTRNTDVTKGRSLPDTSKIGGYGGNEGNEKDIVEYLGYNDIGYYVFGGSDTLRKKDIHLVRKEAGIEIQTMIQKFGADKTYNAYKNMVMEGYTDSGMSHDEILKIVGKNPTEFKIKTRKLLNGDEGFFDYKE